MTGVHKITQAERIASLETRMGVLIAEQAQMNAKLDALLDLRSRGMGAFWLATVIVGTGIIGFISTILDWIRG